MAKTGRSIKREPFAGAVPRAQRRVAGRTWAPGTPLALRTAGLSIDSKLREYVQRRVGLRLGKFAPHIERLTVRFEDVNGPRGGIDVTCGIKAVISGLPSVVVSERAGDPREAFDRADDRIERAVRRAIGRAREHRRLGRVQPRAIGWEGSSAADDGRASGTGRAATAVRNLQGRPRKATFALEGSARPRPSRKSTRGSANRAKHGNKLARRQQRRVASPTARKRQTRASGKQSTKG
jgi:ribosome-associated translation inhibitor RaiA